MEFGFGSRQKSKSLELGGGGLNRPAGVVSPRSRPLQALPARSARPRAGTTALARGPASPSVTRTLTGFCRCPPLFSILWKSRSCPSPREAFPQGPPRVLVSPHRSGGAFDVRPGCFASPRRSAPRSSQSLGGLTRSPLTARATRELCRRRRSPRPCSARRLGGWRRRPRRRSRPTRSRRREEAAVSDGVGEGAAAVRCAW